MLDTEQQKHLQREKALQDVKLYLANDWSLSEETPEYFLLKRRTAGWGIHLLTFLLTWWTLGIGNLVVYLVAVQKKKILK